MTPGKYAREIAGQEDAKEPADYQQSNPSSIALTGVSESSPFTTTDTSLEDRQGQNDGDLSFAFPEAVDWSELDMMLDTGTGLDPWLAGDEALDATWLAMNNGGAAADIDPIELADGVPDMLLSMPDIGSLENMNANPPPMAAQYFGDDSDLRTEDFTEGYPSSSSRLYY
jgi:hypothetical protein